MKNLFDPKKEGKERVWGKVTKPRTVNTGEIDERRWNPTYKNKSILQKFEEKKVEKVFPLFLKKVDLKCGRWKEHLSQRFFPSSFPENVFLSSRKSSSSFSSSFHLTGYLPKGGKEGGLRWGSGGEGVLKSKKNHIAFALFYPLFTVGFIAWVSKNPFLSLPLLFLLYPVYINCRRIYLLALIFFPVLFCGKVKWARKLH